MTPLLSGWSLLCDLERTAASRPFRRGLRDDELGQRHRVALHARDSHSGLVLRPARPRAGNAPENQIMAPVVRMLANSGASCATRRYFLAVLLSRQKAVIHIPLPARDRGDGNCRMDMKAWAKHPTHAPCLAKASKDSGAPRPSSQVTPLRTSVRDRGS
jgi:hypothetical protein